MGSAKADVKVGLDAVKDARSALDTNAADMTKFKAWPLLGWNQSYRAATDLDAREEQYVKDARAFLDMYDGLLAYADKNIDLQAEAEKALSNLETIGENDTPEQAAAKVEASAAKIQTLIDQSKAMTPPAFLKTQHDEELVFAGKLVAEFKTMAAAARNLDVDKLIASETAITTLANDGERLSQTYITKLQRDSAVQKSIDDLRGLNDKIGQLHAKL